MSIKQRHPIDQLTIRYARRFLVCSVTYSVIVAGFTLSDYGGLVPGLASGLQSLVGLFGTTVMLLCGLGYWMFGRSRRLRIRHPKLIAVHFWIANLALGVGIALQGYFAMQDTTPPAIAKAIPIALSIAAGGIFVINVWRSLGSTPIPNSVDPVQHPPS